MKRLIGLTSCIVLMSASVFANTVPGKDAKSEKAIVHIYRPARLVGAGWVFKLITNNSKSAKIKNGGNLTIEVEPGRTQFRVKKSLVEIELEAGKHYYLRASLARNMILGKPEIVEITEQQAKREMANN